MVPSIPYPNHNHLFRRRSCLKVFIPLSPILFGWSWLDIWYYGARYAKDCHPKDLWTSYFTSSDYVSVQRWLYGEPNVIEVRRTFQTEKETRKWETRVLKRMKVVKSSRWLNKTDRPGPSHFGIPHSEETKHKIKNTKKDKTHSDEHKRKIGESCKGEKNGMYGKTRSKEWKTEHSKIMKRITQSEEWRKRNSESHFGISLSEERKLNMSKAHIRKT